jgi:hypothetical protein
MEDKKKRPPQQALASSSPVNQGKDSNPSELPVVFTAALNVLNNYLDTEGIFRSTIHSQASLLSFGHFLQYFHV